jgi:hypothetical protein
MEWTIIYILSSIVNVTSEYIRRLFAQYGSHLALLEETKISLGVCRPQSWPDTDRQLNISVFGSKYMYTFGKGKK